MLIILDNIFTIMHKFNYSAKFRQHKCDYILSGEGFWTRPVWLILHLSFSLNFAPTCLTLYLSVSIWHSGFNRFPPSLSVCLTTCPFVWLNFRLSLWLLNFLTLSDSLSLSLYLSYCYNLIKKACRVSQGFAPCSFSLSLSLSFSLSLSLSLSPSLSVSLSIFQPVCL